MPDATALAAMARLDPIELLHAHFQSLTHPAATLVATRVHATEKILDMKLSEFELVAAGEDWTVDALGRQLVVCPHHAAAAIFEHGGGVA